MTGIFTIMGTSCQWQLDILEYFVAIACMVQENGTNSLYHVFIDYKNFEEYISSLHLALEI
jgi:hypothetical protein